MTRPCPICASDEHDLLFQKTVAPRTYTILRCRKCGMEFVKETAAADDVFATQKAEFEHFDPGLIDPNSNRGYWRTERKIIEDLGFTQGNVLDVGCQGGHFLDTLGPSWAKFGVELAERPAEVARQKGIDVRNMPVEELEFADGFFDVITMYAVIEHLADPRAVMKHVARLLRRGGLLVVMTGAADSVKARLKGRHWHMYCPPIHMLFFTTGSLIRLLVETGFREKYRKFTRGGMSWCTGSSLLCRASNIVEAVTNVVLFDRAPAWHLPFYDHFYCYLQNGDR